MDAHAQAHNNIHLRQGRWLWLVTLGLAASAFATLIARPVHAQEAAGPREKTESRDEVVRNAAPQNGAGVNQPLPLPRGVSEQAVGQSLGAEVPSTPEPETLGAIAVVLSMLAMLRRRARRTDARRFTS